MTISQKTKGYRVKRLTLALASMFVAVSLTANLSAYAADAATTTNPSQPVTVTAPITPPTTTSGGTSSAPPANTATVNPNAPANQPNMSDSALISWASDAARSAYSYDFKNYSKQMQENQQNFTGPGWTAFMAALNKSNNLQVVQNKKLVASATVVGKPTIVKRGVKSGIYFWTVQVPLIATYESESRLIKQNLLVNMLITRANNAKGVGISHFVAAIVPANPITAPTANDNIATTTPGTGQASGSTTTPAGTTLAPAATTTDTSTSGMSGATTPAVPPTVPATTSTPATRGSSTVAPGTTPNTANPVTSTPAGSTAGPGTPGGAATPGTGASPNTNTMGTGTTNPATGTTVQ